MDAYPTTITLLQVQPGHVATKTWKRGAAQAIGYKAGKWFNWRTYPVAGIEQLHALLVRLSTERRAFLIRAHPVAGLDPQKSVRRMVNPDENGVRYFDEGQGQPWMALDFDGLPVPEGLDPLDLDRVLDHVVVTYLPGELQGASFVAQWSSSHTMRVGIFVRLWFWLDAPKTAGELKAWGRERCPHADPATHNVVQAIYTAGPVFDGCGDPLEGRRIMFRAGEDQ